jgi:ketosteroid isomerase-like protein
MYTRLLVCLAVTFVVPTTGESQEADIKALIDKYVMSINGADTKLGAEVWSTGTDVSLIHPMGHERGWEQIKGNFYEAVMGKMFIKRELKAKDIAVHILGDAAWVEFNWEFNATMSNNQPMTTKGRESQVLKKTDRVWRIVHVCTCIIRCPLRLRRSSRTVPVSRA